MPTELISLIGAGGHAKVVLEALRAAWPGIAVRVFDESAANAGKNLLGIAIELLPLQGGVPGPAHVAIGDGAARERIALALVASGIRLVSVTHPAAVLSPCARIAEGAFAAAGAIIGPDASVGRGAIINHGAIVDHDCVIGDWSHIAPNATLGGGVSLGRSVLVGAGATVLPGVWVGDRAIIGAGAVVTRPVPENAKVSGAPARRMRDA
jgi:sugar O-acyltransferase (sialic acid O-acetyltransferase NeuD family)